MTFLSMVAVFLISNYDLKFRDQETLKKYCVAALNEYGEDHILDIKTCLLIPW